MIIDKFKLYAAIAIVALLVGLLGTAGVKIVSLNFQLAAATNKASKAQAAQAKAEGDFAQYRTDQEALTGQLQDKNRTLEGQLVTNARAAAQEKANALEALRTDHAAALQRLQQRPARPITIVQASPFGPAAPGPVPEWCDGSRLWRQDGEFLVGEVAVARGLQAEYRELLALYDEARAKLALSGETSR